MMLLFIDGELMADGQQRSGGGGREEVIKLSDDSVTSETEDEDNQPLIKVSQNRREIEREDKVEPKREKGKNKLQYTSTSNEDEMT